MLKLEKVRFDYPAGGNPVQAVGGITLEIGEGESVVFIGPSGCGKTTLLYLLAGLYQPTGGSIFFKDEVVKSPRPEAALILQDYGLLPWKTVRENVALGLALRGLSRPRQAEVVIPLLEELGLKGLENRYPAQLSGGQRQRVGLARALAMAPSLLLMDEPLSSLDALTRERLQDFLLEIWLTRQVTVVMVTHSIEEAVYLGKRIVVLTPRPARVAAVIDNPLAGGGGFRGHAEFYQQCNRLRLFLGEEQGA